MSSFDAGLLNDFGGGNVEWWQDYIRSLLNQAEEHYEQQAEERYNAGIERADSIVNEFRGPVHQSVVDMLSEAIRKELNK